MDIEDTELQMKLLAFGAIEILSGAIILVIGVFLGSIQGIFNFFGEFSFFTFYSGYPVWGPVSFILTGSSSIASGRDLRRILGLMSLMLIFTSLELCITLSTIITCRAAYVAHLREIYYFGGSRMLPDEYFIYQGNSISALQ